MKHSGVTFVQKPQKGSWATSIYTYVKWYACFNRNLLLAHLTFFKTNISCYHRHFNVLIWLLDIHVCGFKSWDLHFSYYIAYTCTGSGLRMFYIMLLLIHTNVWHHWKEVVPKKYYQGRHYSSDWQMTIQFMLLCCLYLYWVRAQDVLCYL